MLTLVMIVKNEVETIRQTLESTLEAVDYWCILDTGSTDGTQAVVREVMKDIPGELYEEPFVDFATTRNRVIELAVELFPGSFQLMLSGTETLHDPLALQAHLVRDEMLADAKVLHSAYHVMIHFGSNVVYPSVRIFKGARGWRYHGRTHEILSGPDPVAAPLSRVFIRHAGKPGGEDKTGRWEKDLELLRLDMTERPHDPRAFFYYAQTLHCLGRLEEAYKAYDVRSSMGGYSEERYIAELVCGRLATQLGAGELDASILVRHHFLAAYEINPLRAEALFELALSYHKAQRWSLAYLYAKAAWGKAARNESLFIERDIYAWRAADLVAAHAANHGDKFEGLLAAKQAAACNPDDARIQANLKWYEDNP